MSIPPNLRDIRAKGRIQQLKVMNKRWKSDLTGTIYEFGCKQGEMAWFMAQQAECVYCWDIHEEYKSFCDILPRKKPIWVKPHHVPLVDTVYLGGVLLWVAIDHDVSAWIDAHVNHIQAPVWIFRENLEAWVDDRVPYSYTSPGWAKTQECVEQGSTLRITDIKEASTLNVDGRIDVNRFIRCERIVS